MNKRNFGNHSSSHYGFSIPLGPIWAPNSRTLKIDSAGNVSGTVDDTEIDLNKNIYTMTTAEALNTSINVIPDGVYATSKHTIEDILDLEREAVSLIEEVEEEVEKEKEQEKEEAKSGDRSKCVGDKLKPYYCYPNITEQQYNVMFRDPLLALENQLKRVKKIAERRKRNRNLKIAGVIAAIGIATVVVRRR